MLKKNLFLTICFALIVLSSFVLAVEQYGVLSGTVVDESGVGLPGVEVKVQGPALMGTRTTLTNTSGDFRVGQLNVGQKYKIFFTLKGFKEVERDDIRIELGKETRLAVIMKFGEITERIVVTGEIPIVDPKSSTSQLNISKEVVGTLAFDRQYQSIMEMMPGAIPGNNPQMMGATSSDNMYQFDGMESTDPLTKTWSTAMNFDNFEEMQVVAQGAPAEFGRGTGAVINVVTKSGSNQIHGTARVNISKVDWNAGPKAINTNFSDATRYLNETRPAINIGGPVIKDHIWFFGSYERRNKWKPAKWYQSPAEGLALKPTGVGKGYYTGHYASVKLNFRIGNVQLMGIWSEDPIDMPKYYQYDNNPSYAGGAEILKTQGGWNFNSEITTTLGANTYVVGRFSMKRDALDLLSPQPFGPLYYQSNYYWGSLYDYKSNRDHEQYILNLNHFMDTSFGYHDIKAGVEYYNVKVQSPINYSYPGNEYIGYNNQGLTQFKYVYQNAALRRAGEYNQIITFFFQDKWEVTKGLTLNLGLRLEQGVWKNHAKTEVLKFGFGDQLAPRLGAAYSFGKNKINANWGRFYDLYGWWLISNFQPDIFSRTYDYYRGQHYGYPDWTYIRSGYATAPASATTKDSNLEPQNMDEWGFGYERVLSNKFSAGINYMHRSWNNKIEDYDMDGDDIWHFANEKNFTDSNGTNWGSTFRKYDAIIVSLKKNLGDDKFQFLTSYTWSKLKGFSDGDGEGAYADNPYANHNALGYLPNDVRHQLRFYGSVILPLDITAGMSLYWFSGKPYTNYVNMRYDDDGTYPNHDSLYYTYYLVPRGTSGRLPAEWRLDFHLEKTFKFKKLFSASFYIDIFNLLNQQNEIARNSYIGDANFLADGSYKITYANPNYGKFTSWSAPMSFFIGAKVEW